MTASTVNAYFGININTIFLMKSIGLLNYSLIECDAIFYTVAKFINQYFISEVLNH